MCHNKHSVIVVTNNGLDNDDLILLSSNGVRILNVFVFCHQLNIPGRQIIFIFSLRLLYLCLQATYVVNMYVHCPEAF